MKLVGGFTWEVQVTNFMFGYPWVGAMWDTVCPVSGWRLISTGNVVQSGGVQGGTQVMHGVNVQPQEVQWWKGSWLVGVFLADEILPNYGRDDIISQYKDPLIHWYKSFDHCSHWYINHATYQKHHAWGMHNVTILIIFYEYMITVYYMYMNVIWAWYVDIWCSAVTNSLLSALVGLGAGGGRAIGSIYGIFTYIYHQNQPFHEGKYIVRPMDPSWDVLLGTFVRLYHHQ